MLLGSSGVGKSTLINALLGDERLQTGEVRSDGRGRHTTTHRELLVLPEGGVLIDTPGLRELQLWESDGGLDKAFADIAELVTECKFSDCAHDTEPGCAPRGARRREPAGRPVGELPQAPARAGAPRAEARSAAAVGGAEEVGRLLEVPASADEGHEQEALS